MDDRRGLMGHLIEHATMVLRVGPDAVVVHRDRPDHLVTDRERADQCRFQLEIDGQRAGGAELRGGNAVDQRQAVADDPAAQSSPFCDRRGFEAVGMQDVVSKSLGSSNPYNLVRATFDALKNEDSPRSVAARRGLKVSTLQARRRDADASADVGADA